MDTTKGHGNPQHPGDSTALSYAKISTAKFVKEKELYTKGIIGAGHVDQPENQGNGVSVGHETDTVAHG
jgi:hypothetical protein